MDQTTIIAIVVGLAPLAISLACMGWLGIVVALVYYAAMALAFGSLVTTGSPFTALAVFLIATAIWIFILYAGYEARK
ncbi:hypothetical protein PY650_05155 [Rhizobium calliandrae]|uniref:DUF4175 domain-containing protein n=1 Tax=Rhizobium calliandrae TaxID=1312182 RepID=A0ABT7KAQ9_9HYPH|nr:hypothetical protein [Rhizobium calliandrae]MDL2405048.1 hypothetical protein [Rhizobium calliandrae]